MPDYELFFNEEANPSQTVMFKFFNEDSKELCYYMSLDELKSLRFSIDDLLKTLKEKD